MEHFVLGSLVRLKPLLNFYSSLSQYHAYQVVLQAYIIVDQHLVPSNKLIALSNWNIFKDLTPNTTNLSHQEYNPPGSEWLVQIEHKHGDKKIITPQLSQ